MEGQPQRWDVTPDEAVAIQKELREKVKIQPLPEPVRWVAGVDAAYIGDMCLAAAVLWDVEREEVVETAGATMDVDLPYIPGLLSFREAPAMLAAIERLKGNIDVLLIDGQGIAHPRGLGIASHIGVTLDKPTIGCAKKRLIGEHEEVGRTKGSQVDLVYKGQVVGRVVRTRADVNPVFVSVGHKADLDAAVNLVLKLATRFRLPEPQRHADRQAELYKVDFG